MDFDEEISITHDVFVISTENSVFLSRGPTTSNWHFEACNGKTFLVMDPLCDASQNLM